jgi:hypothetical protein
MKKKRKDVTNTTDDGRTILGKHGSEVPRTADAFWRHWKEVRIGTSNDVDALISIYQKRFKDDRFDNKWLRAVIKFLTDAKTILQRKEYEETKDDVQIFLDSQTGEMRLTYPDGSTEYQCTGYVEGDTGNYEGMVVIRKTTGDNPTIYKTIIAPEIPDVYEKLPTRDERYKEDSYWLRIDENGESISVSSSLETRQSKEEAQVRKYLKAMEEAKKIEEKKRKHREAQRRYRAKKKLEKKE